MNSKEVWLFFSELEGQRASSFRQQRYCELLLDAGQRVTLCALRGALSWSRKPIPSRAALAELRDAALHNSSHSASIREGLVVKVLRRIKHFLLADLFYPSVIGLTLASIAALRKQEQGVVILASSPPFSLVLAAALCKTLFPNKVTLLVDMRDAWALHTGLPGFKPMKRLLESWAIRRSDHLTTVSQGLADEFEAHYGRRAEVLYNVASHYFGLKAPSAPDWSRYPGGAGAGALRLIYTGSTPEGFYDLAALVEAAARAGKVLQESKPRARLVFVGACEEMRIAVRTGSADPDRFAFVSHVPHLEVQAIQYHADALVFLAFDGEGNKGVVSTKIFEYLSTERPIFPVGLRSGSDVDRILMRYCGQSLLARTPEEIANVLVRIDQEGPGFLPTLQNRGSMESLISDYRDYLTRACEVRQASPDA
jgi:Glycosyl transferase 4-like domain